MMEVTTLHCNKGFIRKVMKRDGVFIFRQFFSNIDDKREGIDQIVAKMKQDRAEERYRATTVVFQNFNNGVDTDNDKCRLQTLRKFNQQDEWLQEISTATRELIEDLFYQKTEFIQSHASILLSLPECKEQDLHYDFPANEVASKTCYACVAFLNDGGKLVLQTGRTTHRPEFQKGDLVVFRGDKLHAGASYATENVRVHYYFHGKNTVLAKNATFLPSFYEDIPWEDNENHVENHRRRKKAKKATIKKARSMRMKHLNKMKKMRRNRK